MIWLMKKILGFGVLAAIVFFGLQFQLGGRPVKEYVIDFCRSPLVQEAVRQTKDAVVSYLHKDVDSGDGVAPMDRISDEERKELENVLKEQR